MDRDPNISLLHYSDDVHRHLFLHKRLIPSLQMNQCLLHIGGTFCWMSSVQTLIQRSSAFFSSLLLLRLNLLMLVSVLSSTHSDFLSVCVCSGDVDGGFIGSPQFAYRYKRWRGCLCLYEKPVGNRPLFSLQRCLATLGTGACRCGVNTSEHVAVI